MERQGAKKPRKISKADFEIIKILKDVHAISTLESCGLSDQCKKEMKLWMTSWIEKPLKNVIQVMESAPVFDYGFCEFQGRDKNGKEVRFDRWGNQKS